MFSKELQLMDQNTVKYMMDELQEQLDSANTTISTLSEKTAAQADEIARLHKLLAENGIKA